MERHTEDNKRSKPSVHYRVARSETRRCGRCTMYVARVGGNLCTEVKGAIHPHDVCDIFEKRR